MTWPIFAPAIALMALSLILGWKSLPLHPAWTARILVIAAGSTALAVLSANFLVAMVLIVGLLPGESMRSSAIGRFFLEHGPVPSYIGFLSIAFLSISCVGGLKFLARTRGEMKDVRDESDRIRGEGYPVAIAVPGKMGGVLVSRGLMQLLDRSQLQVVFIHEHAHLRHKHHLYSALGALCVGLVPPLHRLHRSLLLALERWADEDTAEAIGDRALVAHTIARVALAAPPERSSWHLALAEAHVLRRVQALLGEAPSENRLAGPALLGGTGVASSGIASSGCQLHHLYVLFLF